MGAALNGDGGAGISSGVLRFPRGSLTLPLLSAGLAGCAGAVTVRPTSSEPPAESVVFLENRIAEPCQLLWVHPRIEDQPLARVQLPPVGSPPAPLARLQLGSGERKIALSAALFCPADGASGTGERTAVLHLAQRVEVAPTGARISISLRRTEDGGLGADLSVSGGRSVGAQSAVDPSCAARGPAGWAFCHTEAELQRALHARDVIRVTCISDRLREMRSRVEVGEGPSGDRRVLELAGDAELCVGLAGTPDDDRRASGMRALQ